MIKSFITSHQSVNLINNGAFEFGGSRLHFWKITGADTLRGNSYSVGSDAEKRFMTIELSSDLPLAIHQSVGAADRPVLDFAAGALRPTLPGGYVTTELKTLPHGVEYTLAFTIKVRGGSVQVTPLITDLNSETATNFQTLTYVEGSGPMTLSQTVNWRRHTFKFKTSHSLYEIGLRFLRANEDDDALFDITDICLIAGTFDNAPYTGDTLLRSIPKGCIVMTLGTACPEGFEEIQQEGFVRSGENRGSNTHSVQSDIQVYRNGTLDFEGYQSKSYVAAFKNSANFPLYDPNNTNDPVDVPDEKGVASHKHAIADGDSIPVSVPLRMCERV